MLTVTVLLNEDAFGASVATRGYSPGQTLRSVYFYEAIEPELFSFDNPQSLRDLCEQAFMILNVGEEHGTRQEARIALGYRSRNLRSLSVSDVLCITDNRDPARPRMAFFACQPTGWLLLQDEPKVVA